MRNGKEVERMHYFELELHMTERQQIIRQKSRGLLRRSIRQVWRTTHEYTMTLLACMSLAG